MSTLSFVFGEELFGVHEAVSAFRSASGELRVFDGQFELGDLANALFSLSLFSSQISILVMNPWFLVEAPTDVQIKDIQDLFGQAKAVDSPILIAATQKIDQRKKMTTWLKKNATKVQECVPFKDWEQEKVVNWLHQRAKMLSKTLSQDAAIALQQFEGTDLAQLAAELEKATLYIGERPQITLADILAISSGATGQLYQFSEALKNRHRQNAVQAMLRLLDSNEDPIKLLGVMGAAIRLYLPLRAGLDARIPLPQLAQSMGKNPYFLKQIAPAIQTHYPVATLKALLSRLCELDVQVKSGQIASRTALELGVLAFCGSPAK